jgi:hypothetical protein
MIKIIKSKRMRWEEYVARMQEAECIQDFGRKARRKEPLGKPRSGRKYNIKMELKEIG